MALIDRISERFKIDVAVSTPSRTGECETNVAAGPRNASPEPAARKDTDVDAAGQFPTVATLVVSTELHSPDVDVCQRCRSRRYVEREWSDGRTDCVCKLCRATIDDAWPMSRQAAENRHARNYAEVFALAAESGSDHGELPGQAPCRGKKTPVTP